jgi:hypothetical protein
VDGVGSSDFAHHDWQSNQRERSPAAAGVGAVLQHDRRRLPIGAAEPDVITVMQPGQWAGNSKEAYSGGLADLVRALSNWSDSKDGKRHGRRVGFPRFRSTRRDAGRVRFTTGTMRVEDDRRTITSVPGLAAKPIIDIDLSVLDVDREEHYLPDLIAAGYQLRVREPGHHMVRTPDLGVHVHVCTAGSDWERRQLLFRNGCAMTKPTVQPATHSRTNARKRTGPT